MIIFAVNKPQPAVKANPNKMEPEPRVSITLEPCRRAKTSGSRSSPMLPITVKIEPIDIKDHANTSITVMFICSYYFGTTAVDLNFRTLILLEQLRSQ